MAVACSWGSRLNPYTRTYHTNRGVFSAALSTARIVQEESIQKSAQENVFGIDDVHEEIT